MALKKETEVDCAILGKGTLKQTPSKYSHVWRTSQKLGKQIYW